MFNLLTDVLPTSVTVDDIEYPINWDAKTMLKISLLVEETSMSPEDEEEYAQIAMQQLQLFYPSIPQNIQEAMVCLIAFYTQTIDEYVKPQESGGGNANEKRNYSFKYDAHLIYSAFTQQYPTKQLGKLHWFEFKALLEGLTEDCLFVKVTQWRSMKITNKMPKLEKQFYRRMKRMYALPDKRTPQQKDQDFASALFNL